MEQENITNNMAQVENYDTTVPEQPTSAENANSAGSEKKKKLLNSISVITPWGLVLLLILQPLSPLILALTLLIAGLSLGGVFRIFSLWKSISAGLLLIAAGIFLFFLPDAIESFFHILIGVLFLTKGILLFLEAKASAHVKYILCVGVISCIAGLLWAIVPFITGDVLPVLSVFLLFCAGLQLLAVNLAPKTEKKSDTQASAENRK